MNKATNVVHHWCFTEHAGALVGRPYREKQKRLRMITYQALLKNSFNRSNMPFNIMVLFIFIVKKFSKPVVKAVSAEWSRSSTEQSSIASNGCMGPKSSDWILVAITFLQWITFYKHILYNPQNKDQSTCGSAWHKIERPLRQCTQANATEDKDVTKSLQNSNVSAPEGTGKKNSATEHLWTVKPMTFLWKVFFRSGKKNQYQKNKSCIV